MQRLVVWLVVAAVAGCGGSDKGNPQAGNNSNRNPPPAAIGNNAPQPAPAPGGNSPAAGAGTLRGQIVFGGAKIPEQAKLTINKDQDFCNSKGPIFDEKWVINPTNKGIRWAVVFLKPAEGEKLTVPEALKQATLLDVVFEQTTCRFDPHVLALRAGQKLISRNSTPVLFSLAVKGFENDFSRQVAAGKSETFTLRPERTALNIKCDIHNWMNGFIWVFDHPYFAVTDGDGKFEIKNAPTGPVNLVVWHEAVNYLDGNREGRRIRINPDAATDVGPIAIKAD